MTDKLSGGVSVSGKRAAAVASRELDARVAEVAGGFTWWRSRSSGKRCLFLEDKRPYWFVERADMSEPLVFDFDSANYPHYSSCLADALPLIERCEGAVHIVRAKMLDGVTENWQWMTYFGNHPAAIADTAPLSIALAALQAMEGGK